MHFECVANYLKEVEKPFLNDFCRLIDILNPAAHNGISALNKYSKVGLLIDLMLCS
jgi:hypothetical protein